MKIFLVILILISNQVYSKDSIVEQDRELMKQYMCKPNLLGKLVNDPHVDVNDKEVLASSDGTGVKYASYLNFAISAVNKCPEEAFKSAKILLDNGADPNLHGTSVVLFKATQAKDINKFYGLLINNGADPNLPLPPALQSGYLPNIWLIYVYNVLSHHWLDDGFLSNFEWGVTLLKNHGVDVNSTTVAGQNALHLAATIPREQVLTPDYPYPPISEVEVNKILINVGVSIEKKDVNGLRPLDWIYLLYNHLTYTCSNIKKEYFKYYAPGSRYYIERQKDALVYTNLSMVEVDLPKKFGCILYRKYK
ncbi:TPA: ankyrin repeat domain-containing protein [Klebsiella quasipneumoniae subsp. similipneumoniae]|nr:ankyrin repeat domain-containing protein [Klebsiella quasipneumoniae subsp. similipneumoniae]